MRHYPGKNKVFQKSQTEKNVFASIWGWHTCVMALMNKHRSIHRIYSLHQDVRPTLEAMMESQKATLPPSRQRSPEKIRALLDGMLRTDPGFLRKKLGDQPVHQGIVMDVEPLPGITLKDLSPEGGFILVLDEIEDPHNIGALWRSAAAFGAQAVMVTKNHTPSLEGVIAKVSCGAVDVVPPLKVVNLAKALELLKKMGFFVVGLAEGEENRVMDLDLSPVALVVGSEGQGLRRLTRTQCDLITTIETEPGFSTLNASVSGALVMHKLFVQKNALHLKNKK